MSLMKYCGIRNAEDVRGQGTGSELPFSSAIKRISRKGEKNEFFSKVKG